MPKLKRLWLARDPHTMSCIGLYDTDDFAAKPLECFLPETWELLTGIHLKPGEVREVESITVKLVPKRKAVKR